MKTTLIAQSISNKLSRRTWLRDAALAATSAAVLPSMLISCSDHRIPIPPGSEEDSDLYAKAAKNILLMRDWYIETHSAFNAPYIFTVYSLLKSGDTPGPTLEDVLLSVFIKIGVAILEVALEEVPFAGAAVAIAAQEIEEWASAEQQSNNVDKAIGEFSLAYGKMVQTVSDALLNLADSGSNNDYPNLREAFKNGGIVINKINNLPYTLDKLAEDEFPNTKSGSKTTEKYRKMQDSAVLDFKALIWNVMFIQAATYHTWDTWHPTSDVDGNDPRQYVLDNYYTQEDVIAAYFRVQVVAEPLGDDDFTFYFREYSFRFDGLKLSAEAVKELFQDDIKGHIINPNALFPRDYVFKQFRREKLDFDGYCEFVGPGPYGHECSDYVFTGGNFPQLIKK